MISLVGSNWGERPTFGGSPFTIPSTLSNAAAIQSGDLILLAMASADDPSPPTSSAFTLLYENGNQDDVFFARVATGTEAAGWGFTVASAVNELWSFVVYRGASIEGTPGGTGVFDSNWSSASQTSIAATLAVLLRTNHGNISGATCDAPSGATREQDASACVNNNPALVQVECWDQTITPGAAVSYSGTYTTNAGYYGTTLILLAPSGGGGGGIGPIVDSGSYQRLGAPPARITYVETLGPLLKTRVAIDASPARILPAPARLTQQDALPSLAKLKGWVPDAVWRPLLKPQAAAPRLETLPALPPLKPPPVETPTQHSLPPALRLAAPEPIPAPSSAALTPFAGDAPSSRSLPPPLRAPVDASLPAVQVLLPGVPESMPPRSLPPPLRAAQESPLPTATVLPAWAPDGNALRALPPPLRALQDAPPPAPEVLLPWVADAPTGRALPPPARSTFDSPLPAPPALVALKFAPDGNALRSLPPPLHGALEPALPSLIALPVLVPVIDWASQCLLPPPLRAAQEAAPPPVTVLLSWMPESASQRALPGPLRAASEAGPLPALVGFMAWIADGGALRALPPPLRAQQDAALPMQTVLLPLAPDGNTARALPPPLRASAEAQALAGLSLSRYSSDASYQRSLPAPLRLTQEPALPGLPVLGPIVAWAQDWFQQRVLVGPSLSLLVRADPGLPGLIASIIAAFGRPNHILVAARLVRLASPPTAKRLALTAFAHRLAQAPRDNGPMIIYDPKHPNDTDSYGVDWTPLLLAGESIVTSVWSYTGPDAALTVGTGAYASAISSPQTKVWYSAGTDGAQYRLLNTVTTSSTPPRTLSRAALLPISSSV